MDDPGFCDGAKLPVGSGAEPLLGLAPHIAGLRAEPQKVSSFGYLITSDSSSFELSKFRAFVPVGCHVPGQEQHPSRLNHQ